MNRRRFPRLRVALTATSAIVLCVALAQSALSRPASGNNSAGQGAVDGYTDGPIIPGTTWRVHEKDRPQPLVVEPAAYTGTPVAPPADATILFDGKSADAWNNPWPVKDGSLIASRGDTKTKAEFGDCQLHVEFLEPVGLRGGGQGRGNSGVFLMDRYEFQVLDCFENRTYADGMTGSIYGQTPPLVNACRKPGQWQTYDIFFTAPRFAPDGTVKRPARATVLLNGILVQNQTEILGGTVHRALAKYEAHPLTAPIRLQDHGNPVAFRNIWIRPFVTSRL